MENHSPRVLITGATGGIGKSFAQWFAARNYRLLLTDLSDSTLLELSQQLKKQFPVEIQFEAMDLTHGEQIAAFMRKFSSEDAIDALVNCAGFGEGVEFCDETLERQLRMIRVHITATVQLVHAILPDMVRKKRGKIITVASMAAFTPSPGSSIYAATKSFLNSFMESIHMEVHEHGIQVMSLCPGLTHTEFHGKLQVEGKRSKVNKIIPWMESDKVVKIAMKGLEKGQVVCVPGCVNKAVKKMIPILPRGLFYALSEKMSERQSDSESG